MRMTNNGHKQQYGGISNDEQNEADRQKHILKDSIYISLCIRNQDGGYPWKELVTRSGV